MANVYSYKRFDPEEDILRTEKVAVAGLFITTSSISTGSIGFETSSVSSTYFTKITGSSSTEGTYDIATIAYGKSGSLNWTTESLTIYNQFTNFFVGRDGTGSCDFNFSATAGASSSATTGFMAILLARDRFEDQLQPGTWQLRIFSQLPATDATYSFTDGAATSSEPVIRYGARGRYDYLYSGSRKIGSTLGTLGPTTEPFGIVYYDYGAIILNSAKQPITWTGSLGTVGGANKSSSNEFAKTGIQEICGYGKSNLKSTLYFCRLGNKEFNFSQNPTYYNPSTGVILNSDLKNSPRTYVTTIGLYNDREELIAVGKTEAPIEKSFEKEAVIACRMDF